MAVETDYIDVAVTVAGINTTLVILIATASATVAIFARGNVLVAIVDAAAVAVTYIVLITTTVEIITRVYYVAVATTALNCIVLITTTADTVASGNFAADVIDYIAVITFVFTIAVISSSGCIANHWFVLCILMELCTIPSSVLGHRISPRSSQSHSQSFVAICGEI